MSEKFKNWRKKASFFRNLLRKGSGFRGAFKTRKINILGLFALAMLVRLFFSVYLNQNARAEVLDSASYFNGMGLDLESIKAPENGMLEKKCQNVGDACSSECQGENFPSEKFLSDREKERQDKIRSLTAGHPMEEMAEYIAQKDPRVAGFLVAIAKKESDWGTHSPQKSGRSCYNYWGYKGGYKPTAGGYSCFDSAEQAVTEVGGKIEQLIAKKVDTPERMVVWKCGSSCAGHDPAGVQKWIADVRQYWQKLES